MKYGKMMAGVLLLWSLAMMACSDDSSTGPSLEEILAEYSVAYEFDDPANVGKDFFGKNNAVLDDNMPALKLEDDCLVLFSSALWRQIPCRSPISFLQTLRVPG